MIRLLTQSKLMLAQPSVNSWPGVYGTIRKLFSEPQHLTKGNEEDTATGITEIDFEEQTAGYQAAYSKLAASQTKEVDVVAYVGNVQEYLQNQLQALSQSEGAAKVQSLVAAGGGAL